MRILKRCLAISVLDLGMNLPNYLIRLYLTVISEDSFHEINGQLFAFLQDFSQILYFSQVSYLVILKINKYLNSSLLSTPYI